MRRVESRDGAIDCNGKKKPGYAGWRRYGSRMTNSMVIQLLLVGALVTLVSCQRNYLRDGPVNNGYSIRNSELYNASNSCLLNLNIKKATGATNFYQIVYDATGNTHTVVVLGSIGQRLSTIIHIGDEITVDRDLPVTLNFHPKELLAAMQLIYWPLKYLQAGPAEHALSIKESNMSRFIYYRSRFVAKVVYRDGRGCSGEVEYLLQSGDSLSIKGIIF
jgi:hypothetical protein